MAMPERYQGSPLLLIIENYALSVIGELAPEKAKGMRGVVQRVWGGDDDWMATVRRELDWKESIDSTIKRNWSGYQEAAREQGVPGSAVEFAMMFADAVETNAG
jgi:hypothetical protein